uniref:27 kDa salivary protein n=1 Tax=Phlebotomus duboscqi TaxID=37738 RepID=Q06K35_PHLDU|nr:27 kDa salivary protein [Phlebotomus duboscqi]
MKLLIPFGVVCAYQILTVSSIFLPVPIITGTTSTSSSGQPTQVNTNISFQNVSNITDMVIYLTQNIGRAMLVSLPTSEDIELVAEILDTFSDGLKSMISASKEDYEENNTTGSEWITDESSNKPNLFDNIIKDIHSIFENFATLFNPNLENQKNKEETNKPKQDSNKAEQDTSKPEENINNPTNFNTENQAQATESQTEAVDNEIPMARRKRNIDTNFKMPELPEASAGLSLITNPLSPSDSISTDSKVSLPDQSLLKNFSNKYDRQ